MDHCGEVGVGFVVARGDAAELFEIAEEVLDQMAPAVHREVAGDGAHPVGFGRDDRQDAPVIEFGSQPIVVEAFVGEQSVEVEAGDKRFGAKAVVALTGQEQEAAQIAQGIDQGDDLCGQPAARVSDRLILSPPLAPVPCWWTRTMVPSMIAYSKSGSADKLWKRLSNTPFLAQRRKRVATEFHLPKLACRSRQGEPVRAIQNTASTNKRLSSAVRPGSPGLPGSSGAIRAHCASLKTRRSKADLHQVSALNQISTLKGIPLVKSNVHRP